MPRTFAAMRRAILTVGCSLALLPSFANATPAACYAAAMDQNLFSDYAYEQAIELCKGTGSLATIDCFVRAKAMFRVAPARKAAALCKGASSDAPLTCYEAAYAQIDDRTQRSRHALQLCSPR